MSQDQILQACEALKQKIDRKEKTTEDVIKDYVRLKLLQIQTKKIVDKLKQENDTLKKDNEEVGKLKKENVELMEKNAKLIEENKRLNEEFNNLNKKNVQLDHRKTEKIQQEIITKTPKISEIEDNSFVNGSYLKTSDLLRVPTKQEIKLGRQSTSQLLNEVIPSVSSEEVDKIKYIEQMYELKDKIDNTNETIHSTIDQIRAIQTEIRSKNGIKEDEETEEDKKLKEENLKIVDEIDNNEEYKEGLAALQQIRAPLNREAIEELTMEKLKQYNDLLVDDFTDLCRLYNMVTGKLCQIKDIQSGKKTSDIWKQDIELYVNSVIIKTFMNKVNQLKLCNDILNNEKREPRKSDLKIEESLKRKKELSETLNGDESKLKESVSIDKNEINKESDELQKDLEETYNCWKELRMKNNLEEETKDDNLNEIKEMKEKLEKLKEETKSLMTEEMESKKCSYDYINIPKIHGEILKFKERWMNELNNDEEPTGLFTNPKELYEYNSLVYEEKFYEALRDGKVDELLKNDITETESVEDDEDDDGDYEISNDEDNYYESDSDIEEEDEEDDGENNLPSNITFKDYKTIDPKKYTSDSTELDDNNLLLNSLDGVSISQEVYEQCPEKIKVLQKISTIKSRIIDLKNDLNIIDSVVNEDLDDLFNEAMNVLGFELKEN